MAVQQRKTPVTDVVQTYSKIGPGKGAAVDTFGVPKILTNTGVVDHATGSVVLVRGKPLRVTPAVDAGIVQNTMDGRSKLLYVSEHGNIDGAWLSVPGMSCIEFDKPVYLLQWDHDEFMFPIASK